MKTISWKRFARPTRILALALGVALGLALPGNASADARFQFGYHDNTWRQGRGITATQVAMLAQQGHAELLRVGFDWRTVEPSPGTYNWSSYDAIAAALRARHIRPVLAVFGAPQWAWRGSDQMLCMLVGLGQNCLFPPARERIRDWQTMLALIAERYPDAVIEIWNEPNLRGFWGSGADPDYYTYLLKAGYNAVKSVAPRVPVLGGSLSNYQSDDLVGNMSLRTFLQRMYDDGAKDYMDGIAFHPYPGSPSIGAGSLFEKSLAQVRAVRDAHGDAQRPLWLTEVGVASQGGLLTSRHSAELRQASLLVELYDTVRAMPDVRALLVHTIVSPPGIGAEAAFGIVRANLAPKPAFCALRATVPRPYIQVITKVVRKRNGKRRVRRVKRLVQVPEIPSACG